MFSKASYSYSQAPSYLSDTVTQTATVSSRSRLQSGSSLSYEKPRTRLSFGRRAFSYAAPAAWNSLPPALHQLTDTEVFKRRLKSELFQQAFITSILNYAILVFFSFSFSLFLLLLHFTLAVYFTSLHFILHHWSFSVSGFGFDLISFDLI